ncbi:MAG: hypothetical protein HYS89_01005 [Candidatus Colwellbacteria bacterium]|nr:hypothetical protein [Candidatus Colwellbacteria bacterium]
MSFSYISLPYRGQKKRERRASLAWVWLLAAILVVLAVFVRADIDTALKRQEKAECEAWKIQAEHDPSFYLVGWQADQCEAVGVPMPGIPVRE